MAKKKKTKKRYYFIAHLADAVPLDLISQATYWTTREERLRLSKVEFIDGNLEVSLKY